MQVERTLDLEVNDTITDFDTENDRLDLTGFDQTINFSDLTLAAVEENGVRTGTKITLPSEAGGGSIILEGVTSNDDITADMFDLPFVGDDNANTLTGGARSAALRRSRQDRCAPFMRTFP